MSFKPGLPANGMMITAVPPAATAGPDTAPGQSRGDERRRASTATRHSPDACRRTNMRPHRPRHTFGSRKRPLFVDETRRPCAEPPSRHSNRRRRTRPPNMPLPVPRALAPKRAVRAACDGNGRDDYTPSRSFTLGLRTISLALDTTRHQQKGFESRRPLVCCNCTASERAPRRDHRRRNRAACDPFAASQQPIFIGNFSQRGGKYEWEARIPQTGCEPAPARARDRVRVLMGCRRVASPANWSRPSAALWYASVAHGRAALPLEKPRHSERRRKASGRRNPVDRIGGCG